MPPSSRRIPEAVRVRPRATRTATEPHQPARLRHSAVMSVSSVCQAEDGKRPGRIAAGMSQGCGEVGVAGQPQRPDGEVAQAGHHAGKAAAARGGGVFAEGHVADPVQPVLIAPSGVVTQTCAAGGAAAAAAGSPAVSATRRLKTTTTRIETTTWRLSRMRTPRQLCSAESGSRPRQLQTSWTQQAASREPAHTVPGVRCVDPDPHPTESSRPPDRRTMAVTMPQRTVGSSCQLHSAAEKRRSIRPVQVLKLIRIVCQPMPAVATRCYSIQSAILHATCLRDCSCWSPVVRNRLRVFVDVEEVAGSIPAAPTIHICRSRRVFGSGALLSALGVGRSGSKRAATASNRLRAVSPAGRPEGVGGRR